jgi:hypothetical protein
MLECMVDLDMEVLNGEVCGTRGTDKLEPGEPGGKLVKSGLECGRGGTGMGSCHERLRWAKK